MAADLRETQENQGVSEKRLDKFEFILMLLIQPVNQLFLLNLC